MPGGRGGDKGLTKGSAPRLPAAFPAGMLPRRNEIKGCRLQPPATGDTMKKTSGSRAQGGARCDRSQQQRHGEGGMMAACHRVSMGDIWQVSASSTYGARGVAKVSLLGRTGLKNPDFRLWHAILRTIAVFLAPRTVFMSVKPVRWPKKLVVVLS